MKVKNDYSFFGYFLPAFEGGYVICIPGFHVYEQGETIDECIINGESILKSSIKTLVQEGMPIPEPYTYDEIESFARWDMCDKTDYIDKAKHFIIYKFSIHINNFNYQLSLL